MRFIYFKNISDSSIIIREFNEFDKDDIYEMLSNENVCRYLGNDVIRDKNKIDEFISKRRVEYSQNYIFYLGIELINSHKIIGYIGLSRYDLSEKTCQVIYALNEDYWYKGLMQQALKLFLDYLINIENKEIIIATHIDVNINSGKVMQKVGFTRDKNYDRTMLIKGKNQKLIGYSVKIKKGETK